MINIDANQGRIGELWWINSSTQPRSMFVPLTIGIVDTGMVIKRRLVQWGTFGFGRAIRIQMEPCDG